MLGLGMKISRRPKRRASSEKAPGPTKRIAAAIAIKLASTSLLSKMFGVGAGIHERAYPIPPTITKRLATGVTHPPANLTKNSLILGKMLTPIFPSTGKPRQSTPSWKKRHPLTDSIPWLQGLKSFLTSTTNMISETGRVSILYAAQRVKARCPFFAYTELAQHHLSNCL